MGDDLKFNLRLDIQIDLKPMVDGAITPDKVKTELQNFVDDVSQLQKKYNPWIGFITESKGWDAELNPSLIFVICNPPIEFGASLVC